VLLGVFLYYDTDRHGWRWHPEKAVEHEAESVLIQSIAITIALNEVVTRIQSHVIKP
jgi:hypothetical protein